MTAVEAGSLQALPGEIQPAIAAALGIDPMKELDTDTDAASFFIRSGSKHN